jgi:hypothetical protein
MKTLIGLILATFALNSQAETFEKILGYSYDDSGVELQVLSGGCTNKASFEIQRRLVNQILTFGFKRIVYDGCLALIPYGVKVKYSYAEMGVSPFQQFKVLNSIATSRRGFNLEHSEE